MAEEPAPTVEWIFRIRPKESSCMVSEYLDPVSIDHGLGETAISEKGVQEQDWTLLHVESFGVCFFPCVT